jgi:hypothetical protein
MANRVRGPSKEFREAAASAEPVLVPVDADIAAWFRAQGDLVREVNNLCRFYMDTSVCESAPNSDPSPIRGSELM